jgi:hypothetical protein
VEMFLVSTAERLNEILSHDLKPQNKTVVGVGFFSCLRAQTGMELLSSPQFLTEKLRKMVLRGIFDPGSTDAVLLADDTGFRTERTSLPSDAPSPAMMRKMFKPKTQENALQDPLSAVTNWILQGIQPHVRKTNLLSDFDTALQSLLSDVPKKLLQMGATSVIWIFDTEMIEHFFSTKLGGSEVEALLCQHLPGLLQRWFANTAVKEVALVCRSTRIQKQILLLSGQGFCSADVNSSVTFRV